MDPALAIIADTRALVLACVTCNQLLSSDRLDPDTSKYRFLRFLYALKRQHAHTRTHTNRRCVHHEGRLETSSMQVRRTHLRRSERIVPSGASRAERRARSERRRGGRHEARCDSFHKINPLIPAAISQFASRHRRRPLFRSRPPRRASSLYRRERQMDN